MARTQAADYEARRRRILDAAAELIAREGLASASIAAIAERCGASKSLIYHYYAAKEDILFAVMQGHLTALLTAARTVPTGPADARLQALAAALMREYAGAAASQKVLLNELDRLPTERRAAIVAEQRELIGMVEGIVGELAPALDARQRFAAAMLFFGMVNWTHTWWNPAGALGADDMAAMAAGVFLGGVGPRIDDRG